MKVINHRLPNTSMFMLTGVFLLVFTMVLHPASGGFEKLSTEPTFAIVAHALAVFSTPFMAIGFFGFSKYIGFDNFFSILGFGIVVVGLIAAILAATLNGIAQPIFAMQYAGATQNTIDTLRPIFAYNKALNLAFDYILIGSFLISTCCWSIAILQTSKLKKGLAILGFVLCALAIFYLLSGFSFVSLIGLRLFIFAWVIWIGWAALNMSNNWI